MLDILLGLSKPEDWKGSARPIVAISNEKLASYVGRSERTVIRAIKQLVEAQVLAYRDSSTGRRWVHRNGTGDITFAYGLDFTPARVRYFEIKRMADEWQAELNARREAKRAVTRVSRAIVDILDVTSDQSLSEFKGQMDAILANDLDAQEKAVALQDLYDLLLEAAAEVQAAEKTPENNSMTGEHDKGVT